MDESEFVRTCALLHDIGKPMCWAKKEPWSKHVEIGHSLLRDVFGEKVAKTAVSHHTSSFYPAFYHPETHVEKVISVADHIASGSDRSTSEHPDFYSMIPRLPVVLTHVLSQGKKRSEEVTAEKLISFTSEFTSYFKKKQVTFSSIFEYLGGTVLTSIPADTRYPDVSLFDHLRLTAAISNCIWREGYKNHEPRSYRFALISADVDRISSYVNASYRLPDLHAGSKTVRDATKKAADIVREKIGPECVIFEGGGSILALSTEYMADQVMKEMCDAFVSESGGEVTISISPCRTDGDELQKQFASVWQKAMQAIRHKKLERGEEPPLTLGEEDALCDVCRKRPATVKDERKVMLINTAVAYDQLCSVCKERRDKGGKRSLDDLANKDPNNLIAVIRADGDDIGDALNGKALKKYNKEPTPGRIATISRTIHDISTGFLELVKTYGGEPVFAGGDDVLALAPAYLSLQLAHKMSTEFAEATGGGASMSAAVVIFDYKLPIYVALETSSELLKQAKSRPRKSSVAFDLMTSLDVHKEGRVYSWEEFKELLDIVEYMRQGKIPMSQLRKIASSLEKQREETEVLIKYNMGREGRTEVIEWDVGEKMLEFLSSGKLGDAFIIYNVLRERSVH